MFLLLGSLAQSNANQGPVDVMSLGEKVGTSSARLSPAAQLPPPWQHGSSCIAASGLAPPQPLSLPGGASIWTPGPVNPQALPYFQESGHICKEPLTIPRKVR